MTTVITRELGKQLIEYRRQGLLLREMQDKTGLDNRVISKYLIDNGFRKMPAHKKTSYHKSSKVIKNTSDNRALIDLIIDGDFTKNQKLKLISNLL